MKPMLPPKKDVALALVERSSVYLYLDPRREGVVVPPWFRKQPELILQVGLNMAIPIPDLRFDDDGVSATLSFKGNQFFCVVPWPSVFAMRGEDGRGMIWPEDFPPEMYAHAKSAAAATPEGEDGADGAPAPKRERPRAVPPVESKSEPSSNGAAGKKKKSRKKGDGAQREGVQRELPLDLAPEPGQDPRQGGGPGRAPRRPAPVPAAAKPSPAPALAREGVRQDPRQGAGRAPGSPPPSVRPGGRPKRELPPYLRVVK